VWGYVVNGTLEGSGGKEECKVRRKVHVK